MLEAKAFYGAPSPAQPAAFCTNEGFLIAARELPAASLSKRQRPRRPLACGAFLSALFKAGPLLSCAVPAFEAAFPAGERCAAKASAFGLRAKRAARSALSKTGAAPGRRSARLQAAEQAVRRGTEGARPCGTYTPARSPCRPPAKRGRGALRRGRRAGPRCGTGVYKGCNSGPFGPSAHRGCPPRQCAPRLSPEFYPPCARWTAGAPPQSWCGP